MRHDHGPGIGRHEVLAKLERLIQACDGMGLGIGKILCRHLGNQNQVIFFHRLPQKKAREKPRSKIFCRAALFTRFHIRKVADKSLAILVAETFPGTRATKDYSGPRPCRGHGIAQELDALIEIDILGEPPALAITKSDFSGIFTPVPFRQPAGSPLRGISASRPRKRLDDLELVVDNNIQGQSMAPALRPLR